MKVTSKTEQIYSVTNVDVWNHDGVRKNQTLVIENGILTQQADASKVTPSGVVIDAHQAVLLPAGVDPQVHLRVPGQPDKESADTALRAAVAGGVAALLTMPNTKPVIDDADSVKLARKELEQAEKDTGVKVLISAAITRGQKGKESIDFESTYHADPYMRAYTDDGVGVVSDDLMRAVYRASAAHGIPILQHAEMPGHGGVIAEGPVQKKLGIKAYPSAAEVDMVKRDLDLLKEFPDARYHLLHISSRHSLDLIKAAKDAGLRATCEVSPHHLWLTSEDIVEGQSSYKMNPPLRSNADRKALRQGIVNGDIDFVATDHAPHESSAKSENFKTAAFGTTGLETSLRVLLTMRARGEISESRITEVFSKAPAEFLGVQDEFGRFQLNKKFYGTLVSQPDLDFEVTEGDLAGKSHNCCFIGHRLNGQISHALFAEHIHTMQRV